MNATELASRRPLRLVRVNRIAAMERPAARMPGEDKASALSRQYQPLVVYHRPPAIPQDRDVQSILVKGFGRFLA